MRALGFLVVIGGSIVVVLLLRRIWRARSHEADLLSQPFPEQWREILRARVPLYRRLPARQRRSLEQHVQLFLGRKAFEACGGLVEVTEEIRLTVAGNACLLLVGRPGTEPFPALRSVLIYPSEFAVPAEHGDQPQRILLGESWDTGSVILNEATVREDAEAGADGFNVVLHEFAHQLDQEYGAADGLPLLDYSGQYRLWATAFSEAFEDHSRHTAEGWQTVIDPYGAENAAEFFACATESFFERPEDLRREIAPVFNQLAGYYRVDPSSWKA